MPSCTPPLTRAGSFAWSTRPHHDPATRWWRSSSLDDSASLGQAAAQLNLCDVAIVQHEYDVYGGADGSEILHLLDQVRVPCVVVLHTVLTDPTPHQRQVLESVMAKADAVVAMTMTARERLAAGYAVDMTKVCIIAHGAPALQTTMAEPTFRTGQFTVLTWGLLGPGKGIEWGIEAMAMLRDLPAHAALHYRRPDAPEGAAPRRRRLS